MPLARLHWMKQRRCSIRQGLQDGSKAVVVENGLLRLTILPELGGKIVSLIRVESGHEFFLQPREPERASQPSSHGDRFENHETFGFDECIPTVAECFYPEEPFLSRRLPDHGDVWSLPSRVEIVEEGVKLITALRSLPLWFTKKVQLHANTIRLDYEVTNLSQSTVKFLWSAHPLLKIEPGAEIVLPQEVNEVEIGWSRGERLGKSGDRCPWPLTVDRSGKTVELNRVASASAGIAEKLFTPRLSQGFCGVFMPGANENIVFRFDTRIVPYVGIWACQGGWPSNRTGKDFTVALEPCNGRPDSLQEGIVRNECAMLPGCGTMHWWMKIEATGGPPRLRV